MAQIFSKKATPGFIYVFEITDPDAPIDDFVHLKVGFAKDVMERLQNWRTQCQPLQFTWVGDWEVSHCRRIEKLLHSELDGLIEYLESTCTSHHDNYKEMDGWESILPMRGMVEKWEKFIEKYPN
ncbi:hypothetical protein BD410DRAFT_808787 [Rickenella mellea]|uniref:Bacteriophage T5 Orf172 DNA-binding domain-containing protein n=1 Tax=Rickenella mellea TaxID=50990 RepID=A0A4Y7PKN5_9AGAM|nr:hypothetical protein BD410DRAFT_808787 [Rickenella mellea]